MKQKTLEGIKFATIITKEAMKRRLTSPFLFSNYYLPGERLSTPALCVQEMSIEVNYVRKSTGKWSVFSVTNRRLNSEKRTNSGSGARLPLTSNTPTCPPGVCYCRR